MRALVVYESMYGNTHEVAEAIADGLRANGDAEAVSLHDAAAAHLEGVDLLVVGGPTHAHGMSRAATRAGAIADAAKPDKHLALDEDAEGEGLREWFDSLPQMHAKAAAFDTRFDMPPAITGRASKGISKRLRRHGLEEVTEPESFFVERDNTLAPGEHDRAVQWGRAIAAAVAGVVRASDSSSAGA
jgi:hypothetical protein